MDPATLQALTQIIQGLVLLVTAIGALYAAVKGHTTAAKVDAVQSQTNGLVKALTTASGDAGFAAGTAGLPNPTPGSVSSVEPVVPVPNRILEEPRPPADQVPS